MKFTVKDVARFDKKIDTSGECWLWTKPLRKDGYANFWLKTSHVLAHRFAYIACNGPVELGIEVDHACRVRSCVNPAHLRATTKKQNLENRSGANVGNRSGIRGVNWDEGTKKWRAKVGHNGHDYYLGVYPTIDEAHQVAEAKRLELFTHNDMDRKAA